MSKSKIMGIHVNNEKVNDAAATLGCLTLKTSFVYFGTKVGDNMSRVEAWKDIVEKVSSRLSRVIKAIHGVDGGLGRRPTTGARSCWSSIVQEVKNLRIQGIDFFDYMQRKLGKGDSTCFWEDKWFEGFALKDMFLCSFALENVKSVTVYKKLNDSSLDYSMRRKPRRGVEEDQYTALSDMMDSIVLTPKER
uniref:RNA-directed DNA polymerase, eukaryota, reverse transcriptase zinc-binding domain protein n=1 Tax=Tanacetum cinerariifolium TaxID=118510 RepID=A0A699IUP9_TANCI|nr:RNA-directed DNA polymerase, eukaryota, reverse transcriptase zinc-binding domain protein [Tanacetum cinerariifolium]